MDSLDRYGTIYPDARSNAYVARRWDGKSHSQKPVGCQLAMDRVEIFLRAAGERPEKAATKAPCTSALTTPTTQAELGKKASGTAGMETTIAKSVAASSTGHTALLDLAVIPTPMQKLPTLQYVDKPANLTSGTVGLVQADQVVDTAVTSSSSASHPSTAISKRSDLRAAARVVDTPGRWQGLFTALVFSLAYRIKVSIHFGTEGHIPDLAQQFAPGLLAKQGGYKPGRATLAPCIVKDGFVTMPQDMADLQWCNHYTPLVRYDSPEPSPLAGHANCKGSKCGGFGFPCIAPLAKTVALQGFMPWPVPGDGDCLLHSFLYCIGASTDQSTRDKLRIELAAFIIKNLDEPNLQDALVFLGEHGLSEDVATPPLMPPDATEEISEPVAIPPLMPAHVTEEISEPVAKRMKKDLSGESPSLPEVMLSTDVDHVIRAMSTVTNITTEKVANAYLLRTVAQQLTSEERTTLIGNSKHPNQDKKMDEKKQAQKKDEKKEKKDNKKDKKKQAKRTGELALAQRIEIGHAYREWRAKQSFKGTKRVQYYKEFFKHRHGKYRGQSDRKYMERCVALSKLSAAGKMDTGTTKHKRHHKAKAGRPNKAEELRKSLFRWFCGLRKVVRGRFPQHLLKRQAQYLRKTALLAAAQHNVYVDLPEISSQWLRRFKKDYGISLRSPCTCFKVPRAVFLERCKICWSNVYRVRLFCLLHYGYDPDVEGFDQTPFHFNESGSKSKKTLDFRGKKKVTLKECQAASRARWSATTYTKSRLEKGKSVPLEALFKGGSTIKAGLEESLAEIRAEGSHGALPNVSVATSSSGSYGLDEVLEFMERHLEPWTEGRHWKILLADAYRAHLCKEVRDLCWSKGYFLVYIGGGCTGAQQVNDTHLHGPLSREYQELEMELFAYSQEINPGGMKNMRREDCLRLLLIAHEQQAKHVYASEGYRYNLFTIPLDSKCESEVDYSMGSEMSQQLFKACNMPQELPLILQDLRDEFAANRLPFNRKCFDKLVEDMPHRGHLDIMVDECIEEYGEEEDGAAPWQDEGEGSEGGVEQDEAATEQTRLAQAGSTTKDSTSLVPVASKKSKYSDFLSAAQSAEAEKHKAQLDTIEQVIKQLEENGESSVLASAKRSRRKLRQEALGKTQMDARVAQEIRQHVERQEAQRKVLQDECTFQRAQKSALRSAQEDLKKQQAAIMQKERAFMDKQRIKKRELELENAAMSWETKDFSKDKSGAGSVCRARKNRQHALFRICSLCDEISPARFQSFANDFLVWDHSVESRYDSSDSGSSHANSHSRTITQLMSWLQSGHGENVAAWWEKTMARFPPVLMSIPAGSASSK